MKRLLYQIIFIFSFYISSGQKDIVTRYRLSDSILHQLSLVPTKDKEILDLGIEISFSVDKKTFPSTMLTNGINAKATPLDSVEFNRCRQIILKTLNKYPVEVIKRNLTKIYIFKELEFVGLGYGGTYHNSTLYLTRGSLAHTDLWLEQSFHHEFSSILLNNYSFLFSKKKWTSNNNSFQYGNGGFEALKQGKTSMAFNSELNKKGILSEYGSASIEEDFNSFAENLFISSPGFWEIEKSQIRIMKKTKLIVRFYNQIDSVAQLLNQPKSSSLTETEAKKLSDSLYVKLINGESFKNMVKLYSKDPGSTKNGGKYTNIKKGQMTPEFEKVALSLNLNEISKPFKTPYGYDIIQLLSKQGEYYSVRHILIVFEE